VFGEGWGHDNDDIVPSLSHGIEQDTISDWQGYGKPSGLEGKGSVRGTPPAPGSSLAPTAPDPPPASAALACHVTQYLTHNYTYLPI